VRGGSGNLGEELFVLRQQVSRLPRRRSAYSP